MSKIRFIVISMLLIFGIVGCKNNDIEDKPKEPVEEKPIVSRYPAAPLSIVTCYKDNQDNEKCFGSEIGLYVKYKGEEIQINDALKQELVTLKEVEKAYNDYMDDLKNR